MNKKYGLYIHIPFCVKKCAYCDFASYVGKEYIHDQYINTLLDEAKRYSGTKIDTIFIGGGTPTCLSEEQLEKLFSGINRFFQFSENTEFSVEANPGTVNEEKLLLLRNGGVNRLSIGVQSFCDKELSILGRIHNSKTALETVRNAQKYFDNINIDIMTALPGQTEESLMSTVKTAMDTGVSHLSCYSLIIEEGTPFYKIYSEGELELPSEDQDRNMFNTLCSYLNENGFERYEISNFAKQGSRCRHNLKYWNTEDYIGIGAAAHSCIGSRRFYNSSSVEEYIASKGNPCEIIELTRDDRISEYVIMALRTSEGVSFNEFLRRFGKSFYETFPDKLEKFKDTGLVTITEKNFALTEKGFDVSNSIMCEFV